uniref:Hexosyltransferase n=1 Tax=Panstrongylus lignarius TaxID=156445 RepID=A0A224XL69_9HEMI
MGILRVLRQKTSFMFSLLLGLLVSYFFCLSMNTRCSGTDFDYSSDNEKISGGHDEYEPRINLAGKPQRARKVPQNLVRPRYYSTELGIRERLFMGVLTNEHTVRSLAVAINKTSSHLVDKLMFFMDAGGAEKANVITLKLPGIVGFVDAQPHLKPFHMLKYLTDNFLEEYDFFFLTKDSTYIDGEVLSSLVKSISVSVDVHAGSLQVADGSPFCRLDGGILLSNSVLRKLQNSLDWCVKNSYSDSDDDNVGRCILHASQLPCIQFIEGNKLQGKPLSEDEKKNLENLNFNKAVTYFKLDDHNLFYQLHLILSKRRLSETQSEIHRLERTLDLADLAWPPGSYPPRRPRTRFDVIPWLHFDTQKVYLPSDFVNVQPLSGADLTDAKNVVNRSVEWLIERYSGQIRFKQMLNGYRRFDPSRGLDYILDLSFRDNTGREIIKRVEASKPLGRVEMLQMAYVTENTRVYLLVPLVATDKEAAANFMAKYSETCTQSELTFLMLVLLYEPNAPGKGHAADVFKDIKDLALELSSKKHKDCKITWISIRVPIINGIVPLEDHLMYFAMVDLLTKKLAPESLVLLAEPNMELRTDYLNRVRMGTIVGKQVYSPIPFTEFNPEFVYRNVTQKNPTLEIHKNTGRFDISNIRHLAFYMEDYNSVSLVLF